MIGCISITIFNKKRGGMKLTKLLVSMVSAGVLLTACGGEGDSKPKVVEVKNAQGKTVAGIERRDSSGRTYLDLVLDIDQRFQYGDAEHKKFADLYWSAAPKDYTQLAEDYVPEYLLADGFKRKDMLKELEPKLDELYNKAQAIKNVSIKLRNPIDIMGYNDSTGGFLVGSVYGNNSYEVNHDNVNYNNKYTLYILPVKMAQGDFVLKMPEADARKLEEYLSTKRQNAKDPVSVKVALHGYVPHAQTSMEMNRYAMFNVDEIALLDSKTDQKIATISSKELLPVIDISTETLSVPSNIEKGFREKFGLAPAQSSLGLY
jgi:hypothetical protein